MSGFTASDKYMVRLKQRQHATCPGCTHPTEDLLHILTCPNKDTKSHRHKLLRDLKQWLHSSQTHPFITSFVIKGLSQRFRNLTQLHTYRAPTIHYLPDLQNTISLQKNIGWYNFLCGFLSTSLVHSQQK